MLNHTTGFCKSCLFSEDIAHSLQAGYTPQPSNQKLQAGTPATTQGEGSPTIPLGQQEPSNIKPKF